MVNVKKIIVCGFISLLAACHSASKNQSSEIRVGVVDGPEAEVMESIIPIAKEKFGLDVKLVKFSDYIGPNSALADGSLDINAFQTKPFLDETIKAKGYSLSIVGNTFLYPIGLYSKNTRNLKMYPKDRRSRSPMIQATKVVRC